MSFESLQETSNYWQDVRKFYEPFETGQKSASSEVYLHEMPGGQYANLYQQAQSLGVGERWNEIGTTYASVNQMFGDIVKVTPSSKVVGDMALYMMANNLTVEQVLDPKHDVSFPESVIEFFEGRLGQPPGGFPPALQQKILRGRAPMLARPGALLPPADFELLQADLEKKLGRKPDSQDINSHLMYPKVFADFIEHNKKYSDTSILPTHSFFYGMVPGEEISLEMEPGKTLIIRFLTIGDAQPDGRRTVFFELNGQPREVTIVDTKLASQSTLKKIKAESGNPKHVAAPMPGAVVGVAVKAGDTITIGQKLLTMEAMKMETTLYAQHAGKIEEVLVKPQTPVESGDLLIRLA
jgi:pyruvate carboxylase